MAEPLVRPTELGRLTRSGMRNAFRTAIVLVPLGSTEQHGPHLPVGLDLQHAEWVARAAIRRVASTVPIVLAPSLGYGSSEHHVAIGGAASITTSVYYELLMDLGRSLSRSGARRLFFLNGHGGNHEIAQIAARDLAVELPIAAGAASWWALASQELTRIVGNAAIAIPGHAGAFETSIAMALGTFDRSQTLSQRPQAPGGVEALRKPYRLERHGWLGSLDGHTDDPGLASRRLGLRALRASAVVVAECLVDFDVSTRDMAPDN